MFAEGAAAEGEPDELGGVVLGAGVVGGGTVVVVGAGVVDLNVGVGDGDLLRVGVGVADVVMTGAGVVVTMCVRT